MNESTPKCKFWQFHLSTAILLMFVAGGLLWANTDLRVYTRYDDIVIAEERGWPAVIQRGTDYALQHEGDIPLKWKRKGIAGNALVAAFLLIGTWAVSEYCIRRREGRKP